MLESFEIKNFRCFRDVKIEPFARVDKYLNCLQEAVVLPKNEDKARLHAFLASREEPGLLVGQATQRGYWNLNSPIFELLRSFFQLL